MYDSKEPLETKGSNCLSYFTASFNALPGFEYWVLCLRRFEFLVQFVGYVLYELRVRELQSYQKPIN